MSEDRKQSAQKALREFGIPVVAGVVAAGAGILWRSKPDLRRAVPNVKGGVGAYSNDLKMKLRGVGADVIAAHGAVSEPVARAMAEGAADRADADIGIGVLYFLAWALGYGAGSVVAPTYEYGNTFLIVAGLLNLLVVIDAYDIALGRK